MTLTDTTGDLTDASWSFNAGSLNFKGGSFLDFILSASPGTDTFGPLPQGAGDYNVSADSFGATSNPSSSDYTFTLTLREISQVPEPATLALLGLGFAGLGFSRRRTLN